MAKVSLASEIPQKNKSKKICQKKLGKKNKLKKVSK